MTEEEFRSKVVEVEAVFDYATEAEKTCSILFKPEQVDYVDFIVLLDRIIADGERLNLSKKLLFRGKTPDEVGLRMPREGESLGGVFEGADESTVNILHGIIGVITEAAELAEQLRNVVVSGDSFDKVHILEETGDVAWYQERLLKGIGVARKLMQKTNIDKLRGRHGATFDVFRDANRDLVAERKKLETAAPLLDLADCAGTDIHNPPEKGMVWEGGCWRFERKPAADIPGMDC